MQKILKIHRVDPEENASKQIDRQMNKTDFIGPLLQSWRFNHVFGNSRIKFGNNQYNKKEYNQHSSVFKKFKKDDP